jgi:hypothetical protein
LQIENADSTRQWGLNSPVFDAIAVLHFRVLFLLKRDRFEDAYATHVQVPLLYLGEREYLLFADRPIVRQGDSAKAKRRELVPPHLLSALQRSSAARESSKLIIFGRCFF